MTIIIFQGAVNKEWTNSVSLASLRTTSLPLVNRHANAVLGFTFSLKLLILIVLQLERLLNTHRYRKYMFKWQMQIYHIWTHYTKIELLEKCMMLRKIGKKKWVASSNMDRVSCSSDGCTTVRPENHSGKGLPVSWLRFNTNYLFARF